MTMVLDHRKYNASTGEFLSVGPLWATDGRGRNTSTPTYAYSTANPINLVDPWGLKGLANPLSPAPRASKNYIYPHERIEHNRDPQQEMQENDKRDRRAQDEYTRQRNDGERWRVVYKSPLEPQSIPKKPEVIASSNMHSHPSFSVKPFIVNKSDEDVYFKLDNTLQIDGKEYRENDVYRLPPGQSFHFPVDGVATKLHGQMVFKVVNSGTIHVSESGDASWYCCASGTSIWDVILAELFQPIRGGWKSRKDLPDSNWFKLFRAAANRYSSNIGNQHGP